MSAPTALDLDKLRAPFPREALKQRVIGGGRKAVYVETHSVINRLNAACPEWSFSVLRTWQDDNVLMAHVELTIPGLGSRQHVGVQAIAPNGGEDMRKGHVSDALKKCATLFGVGLELYGDDYEALAVERAAQETAQQQRARTSAIPPAERELRAAKAAFLDAARAAQSDVFGTDGKPDQSKTLTVIETLFNEPVPSWESLTAELWGKAAGLLQAVAA